MEVTESDTNFNTNSERLDNVTLSNTIYTILSIVKETMKKVKEIDKQVRKLSKEGIKDLTPATSVGVSTYSSVEYCIEDNGSQVPTPTSKSSMTISCSSQSTQCCPTDIGHNLLLSDMSVQTELFLKDYHQHNLNAFDIDSMPNNIKYDIIFTLRTEAEQTEVSRYNTRAIDLYEKAIRLMGSVTPEEQDLPSDEEDPDYIEGMGGWTRSYYTEEQEHALADL